MPISILFLVLMILWAIFSGWCCWPENKKLAGTHLLLFILLFILGWRVFGFVIQNT